MAKQVITRILDDLDGGDADETVAFALDGVAFEIDLSAKNSKKLRDFLDTYISAGTRTGRVNGKPQLQRYPAPSAENVRSAKENREFNQRVRAWAASNGYELNERGRVPTHIIDAYNTGRPNPDAASRLAQELSAPEPVKKAAARTVKTAPAKAAFRSGSRVTA